MKIGIIGGGMVGGTIIKCSEDYFEVLVYDKYKKVPKRYGDNNFKEVSKCPLIFVCLPTVPTKNGKNMDITPFEETFEKLKGNKNMIVLKSTVFPGTTRMLSKKYNVPNLIFIPEFLTEKSCYADYMYPDRNVIGTLRKGMDLRILYNYFEKVNGDCPIMVKSAETAEITKFASNTFFATKVSFANMFYDICNEHNVKWNEVKDILYLDSRIGANHFYIDKKDRGYGGFCIPKDSYQLYIKYKNKVDMSLLNAVIKQNQKYRKHKKEWEP